MLLWTLGVALAQDRVVGASVGPAVTRNDPFVTMTSLELSGRIGAPRIGFEGRFAFSPSFGDADLTTLSEQLIEVAGIAPDISRPRWRVDAVVIGYPVYATHEAWTGLVGVFGGVGAVSTRDDLELLGQEQNPDYAMFEIQNHPSLIFGASFEARYNRVGVRLRTQHLLYDEQVGGVETQRKHPVQVGLEFVFST